LPGQTRGDKTWKDLQSRSRNPTTDRPPAEHSSTRALEEQARVVARTAGEFKDASALDKREEGGIDVGSFDTENGENFGRYRSRRRCNHIRQVGLGSRSAGMMMG
jgi:hypothetical protein